MGDASDFRRVPPRVDIPRMEEDILELWDRIQAFEESVRMRPEDREYVFYDGPPFPTGSPHYGNLLAGVIKDVVPRYWTMRGYRVERRFGWDTHGLPVEMEVQKALGISGPSEILQYGVDRFIEACRAQVQANTENWRNLTRRIGRWVDFDNDYKTLDLTFMESVWWVFRRLWDLGLIYRDFKVLPYSWGASTPLSNFEVNLGGYRTVDDPSITVRLQVTEGAGPVEPGDWLLIWTTTPWTLPGNLAVAVGPDIDYVAVETDRGRHWIAAGRVEAYWAEEPTVGARVSGSEMVGAAYRPPFPFFEDLRSAGAFRVVPSDAVVTDEGTGLVHMAPAYGEEDFETFQKVGLDLLVDPVDAEGRFTDQVPPVAGMNIKEADPVLIDILEKEGLLFRKGRIRHQYPFCYRTDTPLIYKAIPTWFVKVEALKDRMVEHNRRIHWVPEYVGTRRFGNWLEEARDWAVSRNRFWGSCIPVWECRSCAHQLCVGSLDELERLSGVRPDDLHKHVVDRIVFPCPQCGGEMRRVPEVLDVWFESGSMPYGQVHYPFENRERFERSFPARFIAEGLDQTRGWFYTLHVLATALFDSPAFLNCVVNGLILAEDGRKMSKSLKNYPDPYEILGQFGADALRAFLINSPVLRAEPLRFSQEGVRDVVRTVILPLWNTYSFFTTYAEADRITIADLAAAPDPSERPELDRWILSVLQTLIDEVNTQMEGYYLYNVVPPTLGFIDDLTNWYVRRSRRRFWAHREQGEDRDKLSAFATLYEVLTTFVKVLAPVLPFISEHIYQELVARLDPSAPRSVHHCDFPVADRRLIYSDLEKSMQVVRTVCTLGHALRKRHGIKVRQPLAEVVVFTHSEDVAEAVRTHAEVVAEELNTKTVTVQPGGEQVRLVAKPNYARLGPRLGPKVKEVAREIASISSADLESLLAGEPVTVAGERMEPDDVLVEWVAEGREVLAEGEVAVSIDTDLDLDLRLEGLAREVVSRVQQLRREADLEVTDRIVLEWWTPDAEMAEAMRRHRDMIAGEVLAVDLRELDGADSQAQEVDGRPLYLRVVEAG
ncbi:MAG: isoleucine--tRNA ligase [Acidimicrobiia bacterium]|nr:MAG: isoleucine--tRNA ligase [Acidimicrobiia bacterium]